MAGTVYVFAPYIQFVDPHARGDLAEAFSFGLFALALWGMSRLYERPTRWGWIVTTGLIAAVILVHNLMAMVFFGLLLCWALWLVLGERFGIGRQEGRGAAERRRAGLLFGTLGLGVGLAAFFWLPVALEQGAVNLSNLIGDGSHFDFRNHFLSWGDLLALPQRLDWGATEADFNLNLGVAQWALGGLGLIGLLFGRARAKWQAGYFALMLGVLLFLMLPISTAVWENLPFLPFLQFPWRFLGAAAAMLAVLAGLATEALERMLPRRWSIYVAGGLIAAVLLPALPLLEMPPWPEDFGPTDTKRVVEIERAGRWLGTTSTADFLPLTVEVLPKPERSILDALLENRTPDRVNRATLPEGTTVVAEQLTPLHFRYDSTGDRDYLLRLFLFDFPGWQAKIDGEQVEIELARPEGFIIVPVPAGEHTVDVHFGNTGVRLIAAVLSGLALVGVVAVGRMQLAVNSKQVAVASERLAADVSNRAVWVVLGAVSFVFGLYLLILGPSGVLRYESVNYVAEPAAYQVIENFGDQIALIGYDVDSEVRPGETLEATFYWQAWQPLSINYQGFVHLLAEDGFVVAQSDKLNPGDFPTRRWPQDKYVRDEHLLAVPVGIRPGTYRLSVGLWVAEEGWRLPLLDADRSQIGDNYVVREWQLEIE